MKVIALIPARGGSKGIPKKNIYPILGKPLISYSIEAALGVDILSSVWVSSDSDEILGIAKNYNVKIHKRNISLATDESPIIDTIKQMFELEEDADALLLLQPTSPIRTSEQIYQCIKLLMSHPKANSIISVCAMDDTHPARMYWENNSELESILPQFETVRRQDIPKAYYRNGSMYLVRRKAFFETGQIMVKPRIGFEMPSSQLLNIDEYRDIIIAEPLIKAWLEGEL